MFSRVLLKEPYIGLTATTAKKLFFGVKPCHRPQLFLDELINEVPKYFVSGGSIMTYCTTMKDNEQEKQREAIMESLRAVEKYCLLPSSGEQKDIDCRNYDSSVKDTRERDVSKESFLLLLCIKCCRGRWGLTMPINILQGSRVKQIANNNFDKLPVHGLGKDYTPAWWKALARLLISHGYLREVVDDIYRKVSVTALGCQYLQSVNSSGLPPLILELTDDMIDAEYHGTQQRNVDGTIDSKERLSEVEKKLHNYLLQMRMELAKEWGYPPYIICGDETLVNFAKIRPPTTARLANIEGVNEHFIRWYGDKFLQAIINVSQELDLPLEGEKNTVEVIRKVNVRSRVSQYPAKSEAWNAWQVGKKSLKEVAALGRLVPVKEQTVISYILDSARSGCEIDWDRFCSEIGLTHEIFLQIQSAISRIGSKAHLRPIKDEVPENVSYEHIRTFLAMEDLKISMDEIFRHNPLLLPSNSTETECVSSVSGSAGSESDNAAVMNGINNTMDAAERIKSGFEDPTVELVIKDRDGAM